MRRAGKIICWLALLLIGFLLLQPTLLRLFHLHYISPWLQNEAVVKRYLQLAILVPFTLFGTLQGRRSGSRLLIILATITTMGGLLYYATRDLDNDIPYPTHSVKDLFRNSNDSTERIILQAGDLGADGTPVKPAVLKVKPFSRNLQFVHGIDTNHLEANWKRVN